MRIENRTETIDGVRHSWYRLIQSHPENDASGRLEKAHESLRAARDVEPATKQDVFPQFGDLAPGTRYRTDG